MAASAYEMQPSSKLPVEPPAKKKSYVIDPDGEVIFLLEDANAPFAVWDADKISKLTPKKPVKKPAKKKLKLDNTKVSLQNSPNQGEIISHLRAPPQKNQEHIRIQVSAKHLTLASPVFKKTLSGGWKESDIFAKKGSIELVIQYWDLEVFLLFMRIIHCRHQDLPSKVTLEMLAKIGVLADYYACPDAITFFANLWIDQLKDDLPTRYSRDLVLWMFVSWYFKKDEEYAECASIAMTQSNAPITNLDLPFSTTKLSKPLLNICFSLFRFEFLMAHLP